MSLKTFKIPAVLALSLLMTLLFTPISYGTYDTSYQDSNPPSDVMLLSVVYKDGNIEASWTKNNDSDFKYYKFNSSETDSTPTYPENYAGWVSSDQNTTSFAKSYAKLSMQPGKTYYTSISVKDSSGNVSTSNALQVSVPQDAGPAGVSFQSIVVSGDKLVANWTKSGDDNFAYYKFVASESDSTPTYSENYTGWASSDINTTSFEKPYAELKVANSMPAEPYTDDTTETTTKTFKEGHTYYCAIAVLDKNGNAVSSNVLKLAIPDKVAEGKGFFAYNENFRGGVNVATGDLDGDGKKEIISGAGIGGGPQVRVFDKDGNAKAINFFAFHKDNRDGVNVAAGDVNGDGKDEMIVSQAQKQQAWVKVYNYKQEVISEWNAFGQFAVGASVASGDVNGDGKDEVIVGAGPGGGPQVMVYDSNGKLLNSFFAFHKDTRSGVNLGAGNVDGDEKDEIVVSLNSGEEAWTKVYKINKDSEQVLSEFRAFAEGIKVGANPKIADVDGDKKGDIVLGAANGGGPQVLGYGLDGARKDMNFFAYYSFLRGGVKIAPDDMDNDGKIDVVTGIGEGGGPQVRIIKEY